MTIETLPSYLKLKEAEAPKLGRNGGSISYLILADSNRQALFLTMIRNSASGYFSREITPMSAVEACLPEDRSQPMPAKVFRKACISRTANQPGFIACICRAEGLLLPVEGQPHLHQISEAWEAWKASLLAQDGTPYVPPVKESKVSEATTGMTRQELPGDAETESHPGHRKGKKVRVVKPAEGADHAHPA